MTTDSLTRHATRPGGAGPTKPPRGALWRTTVLGVSVAWLAAVLACTPVPSLTFTAAGDYGFGDGARATLALIPSSGAAFHLALGDFSYEPDRAPADWCDFVVSHVGARFPFLLVAGNHEDDFGEHGHISSFTSCLPDRIGVIGTYGAEYYFDYANLARVILISPDLTIRGEHYYYGEDNARLRWLAATIDAARQQGLPWVIVGMHKSCVSIGEYYCNLYQDLWNLLLQKRVDLTLHAHDHGYQRTTQLATGASCPSFSLDAFVAGCVADVGADGVYRKGAGTISVVVATGGAALYPLHLDDPDRGYLAKAIDPATPRHGLLRIRLSPRELAGDFVGATGSGFEDAFSIRAAAGTGRP